MSVTPTQPAPTPAMQATDWKRVAAFVAMCSLASTLATAFAASAMSVGAYKSRIDLLERRADEQASVTDRVTRLEVISKNTDEALRDIKQDMKEVKSDVKRLLERK